MNRKKANTIEQIKRFCRKELSQVADAEKSGYLSKEYLSGRRDAMKALLEKINWLYPVKPGEKL